MGQNRLMIDKKLLENVQKEVPLEAVTEYSVLHSLSIFPDQYMCESIIDQWEYSYCNTMSKSLKEIDDLEDVPVMSIKSQPC